MKTIFYLGSLILVFLAVVVAAEYRIFPPAPPIDRPVRVVITGPGGEHFSGSYVVNGVTNTISAIAPA